MDWLLVSWQVVWIHAVILAITLVGAVLLQIFNTHREHRQATQRWDQRYDTSLDGRQRPSAGGFSATRLSFTKDPM